MSRVEQLAEGVTLYQGDCREILPTLGRFDAVVTDPPYGINAAAKGVIGTSKNAPVTKFDKSDWDNKTADDAVELAISKSDYSMIFGGNYYSLPPTSCWLVWDKLNTGDFADCELVWTNLKKPVRRIQFRWNGMLRQNNEPRGDHPTQKPIEVMRWCIGHLPAEAINIIDPFMGSGTTGVA
ncbi:MAG: DNA methyltransferase, partial [Flammeovirgaceae bacterium]